MFCWDFVHLIVFAGEAFDHVPADITEPRSCSATEGKHTEPEQSSSSIAE